MTNLYDILELTADADERAIKAAFRRMARRHHPDLNPDDPQAAGRFIEIAAAFEVLSDPARRELYDEFGFEGLSDHFDPVRARWERASSERNRQEDERWRRQQEESWSDRFKREYDLDNSSFKNVFEKAFRDFNPFKQTMEDDEHLKQPVFVEPGADVRHTLEISMLRAINGGMATVERPDGMLTVRIPAGVEAGEVLMVEGEGDFPSDPRGKRGDLLLTIAISQQSKHLSREGLDLTLKLPITMPEAILGARLSIPTPHGKCTMTLPEGVHSGTKLRLKEMGVHRDGKKGDFYVVIEIKSPQQMDGALRELARQLERGYPQNPREDISFE